MIHIVPQLPPAFCGVGDYATQVGLEMTRTGRAACCYIAAGTKTHSQVGIKQAQLNIGNCASAAEFWSVVAPFIANFAGQFRNPCLCLLLHYSGYGFSRDGAPFWLADAIRARHEAIGNCHLATFFHELYATGAPWHRCFWQSPKQRRVARLIAKESDAIYTNRTLVQQRLIKLLRMEPLIEVMPVPSNVGEPEAVQSFRDRLGQAVVFGSASRKRTALQHRAAEVACTLRNLGIGKIVDIGETIDIDVAAFSSQSICVEQSGRLGANEISEILQHTRIGLASCPPSALTKSGVIASYMAHGVVPLIVPTASKSPISWLNDKFVLESQLATTNLEILPTMLHQAYRVHSVSRHAEMLLSSV